MKKYLKFLFVTLMVFLITTQTYAVSVWTQQTGSGSHNWYAADSSDDGTKIVYIANNGYIYTSTDSGVTWTERTGAGSRGWRNVTMSADGTKIAVAVYGGYIYTSENGGVDWIERTGSGNRNWRGIASASDWSLLVAVNYSGYIYTSIDGGASWTQQDNSGVKLWNAVTASSDGTKLAATVGSGGYIYTSVDGGVNWVERTGAGSRSWVSIRSSSDGLKLVTMASSGYIYTSVDGGANWTERTGAGSRGWNAVDSSADGTKLAINVYGGYIYLSEDSGANWTEQTSAGSRNWSGITSSSDGTKIVTSVYASTVYTYGPISTPSVTTSAASSIDNSSATLNGSISSTGGQDATQSGFAYGTSSDLSTVIATTTLGSQVSTSTFSEVVSGLSPSTTYYFRAYAVNGAGTSTGSILSFETDPDLPSVTTGNSSSATKESIVLGGEITNTGGENAFERGIVYGLTTSYTATSSVSGSFSNETFTRTVTGLTCGTTYHFSAYATNSSGTTYGSDSTFTTSDCPEDIGGRRRSVSTNPVVNTQVDNEITEQEKVISVLSSLSSVVESIDKSGDLTEEQRKVLLSLVSAILAKLSQVMQSL